MPTKEQILNSIIFLVCWFIERQISMLFPVPYNFLVSFVIFYFFVLIFCCTKKPQKISSVYWSYLFGCLVPNLIIQSVEGFTSGIPYYPVILLELLSILFAWQYYASKKILSATFMTICLFCLALFYGREWRHLNSYGSLYGTINEKVPTDWALYNINGDIFTIDNYRNKIVVFDFWNTNCPSCFKKFPQLQRIYDKYRNDSRVIIEAVNIPLPNEAAGIAFNKIHIKGYSFPVVVNARNIDKAFDVQFFPTLIILKNNRLIFKGDISNIGSLIDEELKEHNK